MKKQFFSCLLLLGVLALGGCTPYANHGHHDDVVTAPTGYWYLNENGERVWRVITPGSLPEQKPLVTKSYPKDMGNGSGR